MTRLTIALVILCALVTGCKGSSSNPTGPTPAPPIVNPPPGVTPPPPTTPPLNPPPEQPPFVTVAQVLAGGVTGTVIVEGRNIRDTSDHDELVFSDGTGEIVVDYPSSNVPPLNVKIRVRGTVSSSEIDAESWIPIP
jgi:hypothetical protein